MPELSSELAQAEGTSIFKNALKDHDRSFITESAPGSAQQASFGGARLTRFERIDDARAFRILEKFDNISSIVRVEIPRAQPSYTEQETTSYRWTYPFPLVSVTVPVTDVDSVTQDNYPRSELITVMLSNERFKLLFEHCFPLKKILSIMTIYTEALFTVNGGSKTYNVFDQVKDVFRSLFYSVENVNNYVYRDPTIESVGRNAGLYRGGIKKMFPEGRSGVEFDNSISDFTVKDHRRSQQLDDGYSD